MHSKSWEVSWDVTSQGPSGHSISPGMSWPSDKWHRSWPWHARTHRVAWGALTRDLVKQTAKNGHTISGDEDVASVTPLVPGVKNRQQNGFEFDRAYLVYYGRWATKGFRLIMNISNGSHDLAWLWGGTTEVTNVCTCHATNPSQRHLWGVCCVADKDHFLVKQEERKRGRWEWKIGEECKSPAAVKQFQRVYGLELVVLRDVAQCLRATCTNCHFNILGLALSLLVWVGFTACRVFHFSPSTYLSLSSLGSLSLSLSFSLALTVSCCYSAGPSVFPISWWKWLAAQPAWNSRQSKGVCSNSERHPLQEGVCRVAACAKLGEQATKVCYGPTQSICTLYSLVWPTTFYSAPSCCTIYFIWDTNGWRERWQ